MVVEDRTELSADLAELIMSLSRWLQAEVVRDAGAVQLSSLERMIMRDIEQNPGTTPGRLGRHLGLRSSNTSAALRSLERQGMVRRAHDPADRRRIQLFPTPKAQGNLARVRASWADLLGPHLDSDAAVAHAVALLTDLDRSLRPTE
ncbi:MAG: MarR family transcriptional regulator [Bifidobacteriaceae bacterium]|nr:MarR family transcriptional regulator [Bifidobacteriaceae bacterium]